MRIGNLYYLNVIGKDFKLDTPILQQIKNTEGDSLLIELQRTALT